MARQLSLAELGADPRLREVLLGHALRGLRLQVGLRAVLVAFALATVLAVPPLDYRGACVVVAVVYAVAAATTAAYLLRGSLAALRYGWLALFGDVVALAVLTVLAGSSAETTWTADLLIAGFVLVPLLASTQLRPGVCLAVVVPTWLVYFSASLDTQKANTEPLASVLLRAVVLAGVCAGAVGLSYIQRSRVATIGGLVADQEQLLTDLLHIEGRERQQLSEQLHDGALQYVLAARMDLEDLRDLRTGADHGAGAEVVERIDTALAQTSTLLRTTVGELYPAVLDQAGLPEALRQIAAAAAGRGGFTATVDATAWPEGARTTADPLLFTTARELLGNVVKHAGARTVTVRLEYGGEPPSACVEVRDDGAGIADGVLSEKLSAGHIGVASHLARVEAAGGTLRLDPAPAGGTLARASVPAQLVTSLPLNLAQASARNTTR